MLNSAEKVEGKGVEEAVKEAPAMDPAEAAHRKAIETALEAIRPNLKRDGGDCELIDVKGDKVYVKMTGACVGCQLSSMTLNGVQAKLVEATGRMIRVIPIGGTGLPTL
jgi:NifU-like protein